MTTNGERNSKPSLFRRIRAKNLLSFGPDGIDLELGRLNVLIGANGSGKSNLLDTLGLLQAAPKELAEPVRRSGGVRDWIWRGDPTTVAFAGAHIVGPYTFPNERGPRAIVHEVAFGDINRAFLLHQEQILREYDDSEVQIAYSLIDRIPLEVFRKAEGQVETSILQLARDQSILSQRNDPVQFPEFARLFWAYNQIKMYRSWPFGRDSVFTRAQSTDVISRPMAEDFSNAWIFLNRLRKRPDTKAVLIKRIADVYDGVTDFDFDIVGSTVQVYLTEGEYTIPASRLSDGSLRFLCLLAILLDPEPPAFIAIEEPELGIHPDLMPQIVDLLVDASSRTQIVVTTHNDTIVDALNDRPEAVVVCEKHAGQTEFKRLDRADLSHWLEKYRLGQLWVKGAIGGTRW